MTADNDSKRGFTLTELLIVLGILAALAAILFPVFLAARERARATACASNLRQLHLAFSQYAADNNNSLPPFYAVGGAGPFVTSWNGSQINWQDQTLSLVTALTPYNASRELWFCPSDPMTRGTEHLSSYSYHGLSYDLGLVKKEHGLPMGEWIEKEYHFGLLEEWGWNRSGGPDSPIYSHGGRFNTLYQDGHVKSQSIAETIGPSG